MSRWFRWYEGTIEDAKFRAVARESRVTVRDAVALWAFILEDAADLSHRGVCLRSEKFMAAALDFEDGVVGRILSAMSEFGMLIIGDIGLSVCNWDKRQFDGDADKTAARRQREKRERDKENVTRDITVSHAAQIQSTDTDIELASASSIPSPKRTRKTKTAIHPNAQPTPDDHLRASDAGLDAPRFRAEWNKYRDHHLSRGSLMSDWSAAWRTWLSKMVEFQSKAIGAQDGRGSVSASAAKLADPEIRFTLGERPSLTREPLCEHHGGLLPER